MGCTANFSCSGPPVRVRVRVKGWGEGCGTSLLSQLLSNLNHQREVFPQEAIDDVGREIRKAHVEVAGLQDINRVYAARVNFCGCVHSQEACEREE